MWVIVAIVIIIIGYVAYAAMNAPATNEVSNSINTTGTETVDDMNHDAATTTDTASNTNGGNTGVSANVGVSTGSVKTFTVEGSNFKFSPTTLNVKKGDTVKIIFKNTAGFHDLVLPEFNVKTKQGNGPFTEEVTFVASKTGSFEYYCSVGNHRQMGMKGTLVVTE
jgi:plastocyanin